jgi:hypothetical protein
MKFPGTRTRRQLLAQARLRLPRLGFLESSHGLDQEIVVSLTTYPARVDSAWQAIRTILRQRVAPDRVILSLYEGDFPNRELPHKLSQIEEAGVEIIWFEQNLRSYLKFLPALARFPDDIIVTADDDTLYPWTWLEQLVRTHRRFPEAVVAVRAHAIQVHPGQAPEPYNTWPRATSATPWRSVFPTGVGGVLYPPRALAGEVLDAELALEICPSADDIWFKAMSLLKGTPCVVTQEESEDPIVVLRSQHQQLMAVNVGEGANDEQLVRTFSQFGLWESFAQDRPE